MGMQTYQFVLNAGQEITPPVQNGTWVSCNGAIADFVIAPDSSQSVSFFNGAGLILKEEMKSLRIKNGNTAQTITLNIGDGQFIDNRIAGAFTISGGVQLAGNTSMSSSAATVGVASAQLLAANATRASVLIQNNSPANEIYIGAIGVSVANGIKLGAGGSMTINTKGAIHAISLVAGIDVRLLEELQ